MNETEPERRPRDLGNDQMAIRTTTDGVMTEARLRLEADLKSPEDNAVARRFFERGLAICDWFAR